MMRSKKGTNSNRHAPRRSQVTPGRRQVEHRALEPTGGPPSISMVLVSRHRGRPRELPGPERRANFQAVFSVPLAGLSSGLVQQSGQIAASAINAM